MRRSFRKLYPATIPSLVEENQTIEEFWNWEETRPYFDDRDTGILWEAYLQPF
jgi:hypothetical protein